MKTILSLVLLLSAMYLSGCGQRGSFNLQGKAGDIGDAMEHCRAFMNHLLPDGTFIYIDSASSREADDFFDIFLDIHDKTQEGFAQCRVNKRGLITYHAIREFRQKGRSFSNE